MATYLLKRLTEFVLTLWAVSLIVFVVMTVLPGDPALAALGTESTADARAAYRSALGLDAPAYERYFSWIWGFLRGDLGQSYAFKVPVTELILERLPLTLPLAFGAMAATLISAITFGLWAAARRGRPTDWVISTLAQIGIALPVFWLALMLVLTFSVYLGWLPSGGFPDWSQPIAALRALILPIAALTLVQSAVLLRLTRSAALDVLSQDYIRTERALGITGLRLMFGHVLPNALVPVITIAGMQFASLMTGTIVIENVFSLPGLGKLLSQTIANRDAVSVQALVMLFATLVLSINLFVDLVTVWLDPRLKRGMA